MKIRVINESDWERTYDFDRSIIRVGSQLSCDIQLKANDIQPMHMQIVRSGVKDVRYVLRVFADNVMLIRGEQRFSVQQMTPYDILDGDKLSFCSFRMIINLEDEGTRIRTTQHMEAKMYLQKRELTLESPINGVLKLKNLGTEKACQFRMIIKGIPSECLQSTPLPYLYPGGVSTVGFMISHLQTKPAPGFHTVSITLIAPNEYFGEVLEFNQDIYVNPIFKNEIILEDDSEKLTGFNKEMNGSETQQKKAEDTAAAHFFVRETSRMIPGQAVTDNETPAEKKEEKPVVISAEESKNAFDEETDDEENGTSRPKRRSKRQKVLIIHHDEDEVNNAFDEEPGKDQPSEDKENSSAAEEVHEQENRAVPDPESENEKKTTSRRKKSASVKKETGDAVQQEPEEIVSSDKGSSPSDFQADSAELQTPQREEKIPDAQSETEHVSESEKSPEPEDLTADSENISRSEDQTTESTAPSESDGQLSSAESMPEKSELSAESETSSEQLENPSEPAAMIEDQEPEAADQTTETTDDSEQSETVEQDDLSETTPRQEETAEENDIQEIEEPDPFEDAENRLDLSAPQETDVYSAAARENDGLKLRTGANSKKGPSSAIPVVYHNSGVDFSDTEPADEPQEPENPVIPAVKFVKGGGFDD